MFCKSYAKAVLGSVVAFVLFAGSSYAADRFLVFKMNHKTNVLPKRSNCVWIGFKPKVGENVPVDAVVMKMPDEPKDARPADFKRTNFGLEYDPE